MHKISVVFGRNGTLFGFLFKTKEAAEAAAQMNLADLPEAPFVGITDDFGQSAHFRVSEINCIQIEDLDLSANANIEMGLHHARTQAKANQLGQQDPKLRTAAMLGGNGLIHPGPVPRQ